MGFFNRSKKGPYRYPTRDIPDPIPPQPSVEVTNILLDRILGQIATIEAQLEQTKDEFNVNENCPAVKKVKEGVHVLNLYVVEDKAIAMKKLIFYDESPEQIRYAQERWDKFHLTAEQYYFILLEELLAAKGKHTPPDYYLPADQINPDPEQRTIRATVNRWLRGYDSQIKRGYFLGNGRYGPE